MSPCHERICHLNPYATQDRESLEKGILKNTAGYSGYTNAAWLNIEGRVIPLAAPFRQDKLTEGLIRLVITKKDRERYALQLYRLGVIDNYVPIDSIGPINKQLCGMGASEFHWRHFMQTIQMHLGMQIRHVYDYMGDRYRLEGAKISKLEKVLFG